jgi:uncharacterized protein YoxC
MSSPDTLIPIITGFLTILAAIVAAVYWVTHKVTGLEKDVKRFQEDLDKVSNSVTDVSKRVTWIEKRAVWIERSAMIKSFKKGEDVIKEIEKEEDNEE